MNLYIKICKGPECAPAVVLFTRPAVLYIKNVQKCIFSTQNVQYAHWQGQMYMLCIFNVHNAHCLYDRDIAGFFGIKGGFDAQSSSMA